MNGVELYRQAAKQRGNPDPSVSVLVEPQEIEPEVWKCPRCGSITYGKHAGSRDPNNFEKDTRLYCTHCIYDPFFSYGTASHFEDDSQPGNADETVTRRCEACGGDINHLRPQATTCSPKCRKRLERLKA